MKTIAKLDLPLDSTDRGVPALKDFQSLQPQRFNSAVVRKIGLLNHMGGGNLGDDATQVAVIENIKRRWPKAEIFGFSMNPADTEARHGIHAYPIRSETWTQGEWHDDSRRTFRTRIKEFLGRHPLLLALLKPIKKAAIHTPRAVLAELLFLRRSYRIIRSFDLLIVSGGGQLLDSWGGPWKFPYTIFKWTLLAKISGARCFYLNVGAGPLKTSLARWFVRHALQRADYISFRDENSRTLAREVGFSGQGHVFADCVYALDSHRGALRGATAKEAPIVGLAPMAYCDPRIYWQKDQAVYDRFIRDFASFGSWLSANRYLLALFSTDIFFDSQTIDDVRAAMARGNIDLCSRVVKGERITGVDELLSQMNSMDYVVTCRFHGVVFAHLMNKPVLALSHHPKVFTLMNDLGLAKYCMDIRKCDVNQLKETFLSLVADSGEIRGHMAERLACYRRGLTIQFDQLFPQEKSI